MVAIEQVVETVALQVNGVAVTVPAGASVLDAARAAGADLPSLCKDRDQPAIGACRTCLVEIEGMRPYPAACSVPAREGLAVRTDTAGVERVRAGVLSLTMAMGQGAHSEIATVGRSELRTAARSHEVGGGRGAGSWGPGFDPSPTDEPAVEGRDGVQAVTAPLHAGSGRRGRDTSNPFFTLNHDDCILCARCVVACQDVQHIGAIAIVGRNQEAHVGTFADRPIVESICTSCGQCVSVCPTGAILPREWGMGDGGWGKDEQPAGAGTPSARAGVPQSGAPSITIGHDSSTPDVQPAKAMPVALPIVAGAMPASPTLNPQPPTPDGASGRVISSTCPYCGVGCGVGLRVDGRDMIRFVDDRPENGSSDGMLCVKGRFGTTFVHSGDRLTTPLIRRDGQLVPCSWEEALEYTADRLVEHRGAFASLASAKGTNEDGYVQQKFVRMLMGTNNIDHCTRLCHSPSVEAMLQQLGSGATSNSYDDYERAGCLVVVGCDPSSNHPVIASRLRRAVVENGARLIVINPRRIDLCDYTDLWLRPYPGTDVALFNALAKVILDEGLLDEAFVAARTEEFEAWRAAIERVDVAECARITGVDEALIRRAARRYARPDGEPQPPARAGLPAATGSCLIWGMGITQHTNGTANAHALLNMALLTGQLGRPGSGVSPLRGQNNVQGCGDAGCIPDSLPGYQGLGDAARDTFAGLWGAAPPEGVGLRATDMIEQAVTGEIRAMYIVGENPMLSEPNLAHAREGIAGLDFLVVQDIFLHETAELAHVVLPAAAFAEKDGTFTNSERRVQRVRQAIPAPGEARPDWEIVCDLARRVALRLDRDPAAFSYEHPSQVWAEMGRAWGNIAGISYERLDIEGGLQWPCPTPEHPGTSLMYTESFPRGLGKFVPVEQGPVAVETPDERFPLVLNTGRVLYHWHGGTMTRRVAGLVERAPVVPVAVHPADAARFDLTDGQEVIVSSRRGEMTATVSVTEAVREGAVFVPFVRLAESAANWLTNNVYDDESRIPEYKVCAVRLDKPGAPREWRRGRHRAGRRNGAVTVRPGEA